MAGRKAPRPLPRPVRWLAMFLALVFVVNILLILLVQAFQSVGTFWANQSDKRLRK